MRQFPHSGPEFIVTIASSSQQSNTNPNALPSKNSLVAHTAKQLNNQHPKSHHLNSLIKKPQTQETEKHPYSVITTANSADKPRPTGHSPALRHNR